MKKILTFALFTALSTGVLLAQTAGPLPKPLLPLALLNEIINEASGEMALQNELLLAGVNRNRPPEEYVKGYFETRFLLDKLKEYGADEAAVIDLPADEKTTWDAEAAELWVVEPGKKKIADLDDIAASLCSGSGATDTTAELVYVGPGSREENYKGKSVKGKIVLVNGYPGGAQKIAVAKYGAKGVVAFSSSHPEFDRDEVGWGSVGAGDKDKPTFGFMISQRLGQELRDELERGTKIVLRALVKARTVPYREQMVMGLLKGRDYPGEELVFSAHLYEGFAKQGANDNISGCTAILETLRVIRKLEREGKIQPLRRSIRFLFVPEISGTAAFIKKYPDIAKRFFANINHDMVGEGLVKNQSAFRLTATPFSLPSYLNDVAASFVEWVGATQRDSQESGWREMPILSPAGSRDPFYFSIDPYSGGSDHVVFVDGAVRVPSAYFNVWPDQWYHTSGDTADKSDSTQFKRVIVISAAMAVFLGNAGPGECERMMSEVGSRFLGRLGLEKRKAEILLQEADGKSVHTAFRESLNVMNQAFAREKEALSSVRFFFKGDKALEDILSSRLRTLDEAAGLETRGLEDIYAARCRGLKVVPRKPEQDKDQVRLAGLVPVRTAKMGGIVEFWRLRDKLRELKYSPPLSIAAAQFELRNFIDGKRSILDIRNAASAEYGPLRLYDVEAYMKFLEKLGMVEIRTSRTAFPAR